MIDKLEINCAGYFFRKKNEITKRAIEKLFRHLRRAAEKPSKNLFQEIRSDVDDALCSVISFSFDREVSFLTKAAKTKERIYGFLMIVEYEKHVALFKKGLDLPSSFRNDYLIKVSHDQVESAVATDGATFEKLRLRNMSVSRQALRSKSLEARDLEKSMSTLSASRFVPQGYSVRRLDGFYSATPSTGRISERSDRVGKDKIVDWAKHIITSLENKKPTGSEFIKNFATPVDMSSLCDNIEPKFVLLDTSGLEDKVFNADDKVRLVRAEGDELAELDKEGVEAILKSLEDAFSVSQNGIFQTKDSEKKLIGELRVRKTRISLVKLDLAEIANISVEKCSTQLGQDDDAKSLARYLDQNDLFIVLFNDIALAYISGSLFRDQGLLDGGKEFLRYFHCRDELKHTESEKGELEKGQDKFAESSVFRAVVDKIADDDDVLICDDLNDEWADFIGIQTENSIKRISFYHAKHEGEPTLGASKLHDAVGQGIKNLGRMRLPAEAIEKKLDTWDKSYHNDGVETNIKRFVRGGCRAKIEEKIQEVQTDPDVFLRTIIVTSSLSIDALEKEFKKLEGGKQPKPYFVQLYWLLMSYFSACAEMGVHGSIICRP